METTNGNKNGTSTNNHRYAFDNFEIDPANRLLMRDGDTIPLTGKVFDILLVFAESPGRLLEKDELLEKVWSGDFVEEGNLARNVSTLRKALGEGKDHKYIVTVQGRGYRFVADVSRAKTINDIAPATEPGPQSQTEEIPEEGDAKNFPRRWFLIISAAVLFLTAAVWIGGERFFSPASQIKSLAVLPLRSIDANDNYIGAGIADAVIRRISQTRELTVRPTSAVLRYVNQDTDALSVARELNTDAILEGTVQRSDERLRVSVNLLRSADGTSLWADSFDLPASDVFAIQDKVAQQVAMRLRLHLNAEPRVGLNNKYPTSPVAYELYIKGIFSLDQRDYGKEAMPQMQGTIDFLKKAIEADPNYALAHAQLAFAYVWTSMFIEQSNPKWADLARGEIKRSQELDAQLAETHIANGLLLWSSYGGYDNDAALREFVLANQLNPNCAHSDLTALYAHSGLEDLALRELSRGLDTDPTSKALKDLDIYLPYLAGKPDEWLVNYKTVSPGGDIWAWYFLRKGRLDEAQSVIDESLRRNPKQRPGLWLERGLFLALRGEFDKAAADIPDLISKINPNDEDRHHTTYDAACVYALAGNSTEAVKWLRETANTGFSNYPLFARDPYLDRIRQAPEFVQFMVEQKAQWERRRQEFGE